MIDDGSEATCFDWVDRTEQIWLFRKVEGPTMVSWYGTPCDQQGRCVAQVKTHEIIPNDSKGSFRKLEIARLENVHVESPAENRGVGSMLVKAAIEVCKQRGNSGLDGELSCVDRRHFRKLEHFYEKLGFTFKLFDNDQLDKSSNTVGKIFMRF